MKRTAILAAACVLIAACTVIKINEGDTTGIRRITFITIGLIFLLMAFYITHHPIKKNMGKILLYCVAGFGVSMILFGLSSNFWLSLFLLMMSGVFDCVSVIVRGMLLQTLTPENMKGRVSAVNHIFIGSSNEIGMFESGVAAKLLGTVTSVVFGGCMTLVSVGVISILAKSLRKLQRVH